ncbi:DUF5060 domain-containing protein [Prolixibacteraceae bacterium Z1-6]|uniref:DUF5060 domain-containing protein n=1 Tax=Draconibacterium aestuarii TaxID=2998507 RepID=A0A9X3F237_9BACT|nr:DUF5060 domain-containing protein [Prolixibacteraceae bacterium Z1-6]
MKNLIYLFSFLFFISCQPTTKSKPEVKIEGELQQWHKITLVVIGPESSEWAKENPFLDYKLEGTFTKGSKSITVPGYFAADGNAGETSASAGNIWKIHFRPDEAGLWNYKISFRKGKDIAVSDGNDFGETLVSDGRKGTLGIAASDKTGEDFRSKGRIINGGKGYFKFQESDELWIKNGTDSPENFLAYHEFDQTSRYALKKEVREGEADPAKALHKYEPHIAHWKEGNPTWKGGKGKGIIGAINYLNSVGVNSVYMLTMNIIGDGKDVWPYNDHNERYRFDCSKLDQWEVVFDYMEKNGIMAHFVLQETENECLLDMGYTGVQRKLYLRELIARFGHHLAVTWNLGEENGPTNWSPIGQTDAQKKAMASYIKAVNPYLCNVVLHTHSNDEHQDEYLNPMLGFNDLDGPSLQIANPKRVHERVKKWVSTSEKAGLRWLVNLDEIGPAWKGVMPDSFDADHDTVRQHCLWGTLLSGGTGVEWYFGYRFPHNDLNLEDFRSRENWWKQSTFATQFIKQFPLEEMKCLDELVRAENAYCLAKSEEIYIVYLPAGTKNAKLHLIGNGSFSVKWFNPRIGGDLQEGTILNLTGPGFQSLGYAPADVEKDWVVLVQRI